MRAGLTGLGALIVVSCGGRVADPPGSTPPETSETVDAPRSFTVDPFFDRPRGLDPFDDLSGLQGLQCAEQQSCAPVGEAWLGDTCCAFGDPMSDLFHDAGFPEGVDIEAHGRLVVACSGFGAIIGEALPDGTIAMRHPEIQRCQRAAIGPRSSDGSRLVFLAHHGDTWVPEPELAVVRRDRDTSLETVTRLTEKGVLYEGLALVDGYLWVATHAGGVRIYEVADDGGLTWVNTVDGFANAAKIAVDGALAYVSDGRQIQVFDATDPVHPTWVHAVATEGTVRDVEVDTTHVFAALGSGGVQVLRREGNQLVAEQRLELDGSIQAIALRGDHVAVAAWDHLGLLERDGFDRIGGIKLKEQFEETFAVAFGDDFLFALEWYGVHTVGVREGFVAPELAADAELVAFAGDRAGSSGVWLRNRGPLNVRFGDTAATSSRFSAHLSAPRLRPGERTRVQVDYTPPAEGGLEPAVRIYSNDPSESPLDVLLSAQVNKGLLDVGDVLTKEFGFLDPSGAGDLEALRGKVTVIAYFALF